MPDIVTTGTGSVDLATPRPWFTLPAADEGVADIVAEFQVIPFVLHDTAWVARDASDADATEPKEPE